MPKAYRKEVVVLYQRLMPLPFHTFTANLGMKEEEQKKESGERKRAITSESTERGEPVPQWACICLFSCRFWKTGSTTD